ncbi:hypothetical protein Tco_1105716 [Tanacetum coccineum]
MPLMHAWPSPIEDPFLPDHQDEVVQDLLERVEESWVDLGEEERNDNDDIAADGGINETDMEMPVKEAEKETEAEKGTKNKQIKRAEREETEEASSSQSVGYYLKHKINEKLIE